MPNRLINETSPYLLQHAHNPVDWYPWGEEAFARAKAEDKPVLLSVGYSTCHWCHVMERESFENELIARFMKEHFISIKVDREERPDIDHIYMEVLQATTGHGGWPMTVFLTPDREPFFCGTYFPPEEREGMPSFPRILKEAADAYADKRNETYAIAKEIAEGLRRSLNTLPSPQPLSAETLDRGYKASIMGFDHQQGGFGFAPKFPQPMMLEFLLHYYRRTGQIKVLEMAEKALQRMADGGIHDQIGGGFHRYSVDHLWIVPHFEKMLYDNALLSQVYLHAYQVTRKDTYKNTAEHTLDYLLREMRDPSGGFYSAQDADSEGIEGKYYVWTAKEILEVLGTQEGKAFNAYFGVTDKGNFEGSNVLNIGEEVRTFLSRSTEASAQIQEVIERGKAQLLAARHKRVKPSCDDKMVTWLNGLAIIGFAEAASILGREDYRQAAVACAEFVLRELLRGDTLLHTHRQGKSSIPGFLDDYALLIRGLLSLHEATLEQRWLESALQLADMMISRFSDKNTTGLLYDTQGDQADLLTRPHDTFDSVKPSGASAAVDVLLRLAVLTGKKNYEKLALAALSLVRSDMQANPIVHGNWLCALDFALSGPTEIAIIGNLTDPRTKDLLATVYRRYLPNKVIVGMDPGQKSKVKSPLLEKRKAIDGRPTVYLCYKNTCQAPTTDPSILEKQLEGR